MIDLKTKNAEIAYQLAIAGRNLLVLGQAGSGKSVLIHALTEYYTKKKIGFITTAPTHKAALGVNGVTLASRTRRDYGHARKEYKDRIFYNESKLANIVEFVGSKAKRRPIEVLIIDEFGMVRADQLQELDIALRNTLGKKEPFGGIQLIAVGDYKQIPPVLTDQYSDEYFQRYTSIYNFCAPAFQEANFFTVNLTENIRMERNPDQAKLLEMIRKQEQLDYVAEELNKILVLNKYVQNDNLYVSKYNVVVNKINRDRLDLLEGKMFTIYRRDYINNNKTTRDTYRELLGYENVEDYKINSATRTGIQIYDFQGDPHSSEMKDKYTEVIVRDTAFEAPKTQVDPYPRKIEVKIGAKVLTYENGVSVNNLKYYNGQTFTLKGSQDKQYLVLEDDVEHKEYVIRRSVSQIIYQRKIDGEYKLKKVGLQAQFPIMLAYAQTYHKTQGMTLHHYTLDTRGDDFVDGLTYVGLSRAIDLRCVTITAPIKPSNLVIEREVMDFYERYGCF